MLPLSSKKEPLESLTGVHTVALLVLLDTVHLVTCLLRLYICSGSGQVLYRGVLLKVCRPPPLQVPRRKGRPCHCRSLNLPLVGVGGDKRSVTSAVETRGKCMVSLAKKGQMSLLSHYWVSEALPWLV